MTTQAVIDNVVTVVRDGVLVVLAGGVGGLISTAWNNHTKKALDKKRRDTDHDLADQRLAADRELADQRLSTDRELAEQRARADERLAQQRAHTETLATVRADRRTLYLELHDALRTFTDHYNNVGLSSGPPVAGVPVTTWTLQLHARAVTTIGTYDALQSRVALLAPGPIRATYAALRKPLEGWKDGTAGLHAENKGSVYRGWNDYIETLQEIGPQYARDLEQLEQLMRADLNHPDLEPGTDNDHQR